MPKKKKIGQSGNYSIIKMDKQIAQTPVCRNRNGKYIQWGAKNRHPNDLLDLYSQSPTLKACISFCVQALVGNGLDYEKMKLESTQLMANYEYGFEELLRRISLDYFLYGSFAINICLNRDRRTYSCWHVPLETVRCAPRDEDGKITKYFISSDWTTPSIEPIEVPSLVMRSDEDWNLKAGENYLYVYETYSPTNTYYSCPIWSQAIKAVQSEIEMIRFDLRTASNVFCPAGAIQLPPVSDENDRQAIIDNIQKMFTSADGAQQLLISFREDSQDEPVSFTPFSASHDNVDLFSTSNERNVNRILSVFGIPTKALIGLPMDNAGFSSEGQMLETSFNLFCMLSGNHSRQCVVGVLNQILKANGIDVELILKPLTFLTENNTQEHETEETTNDDAQDIAESNITEPIV